MTGPLPPQDLDAERAVLGACLLSPEALRTAQARISDDDWYRPHHMLIWQAMRALVEQGSPVDPITVHAELAANVAGRFANTNLPLLLHDLTASVATTANVAYYCDLVVDAGVRRRMIRTFERGVQRAFEHDGDTSELIAEVAADLAVVQRIADGDSGVLSTSLTEFMAEADDVPPWLVPGLLARQDRVVLTGSGGIGKSTFVYQFAVCAAAGLDPFDPAHGARFNPLRVSIFDCENPDYLSRARLRRMLANCRALGVPDTASRIAMAGHGNPLNLLDARTAAELVATVAGDRPDLVCIGPFYKLHNDDPDREVVVKRVTDVLDRVRATGAAIILEAHTNKEGRRGGPMEPSGSNVWTWWPEFGMGMRLDEQAPDEMRLCALERWRIDRMQRAWPVTVEAGADWPWRGSAVQQ